MQSNSLNLTRISVLSAVCVALNIGLNKIAVVLALPVFMDTIGTILSAALVPLPFAVLVGVVSNLIGGVITHPAIPFYIGTQAVIALMAVFAFRRGWFHRLPSALLVGLIIGIVSAIVSAPITVIVFGGITAPGATAINAVLMAAGQNIWTAVLSGTLIISSVDKVIAAGIVWLLLQRLPDRMKLAQDR
jgi:energy-coupling factor transport system substrate-specific component